MTDDDPPRGSFRTCVRPANSWLAGTSGWWWQLHVWDRLYLDADDLGWVCATAKGSPIEGFEPTEKRAHAAADRVLREATEMTRRSD